MDLNKNVSLPKKRAVYPSKTTLNLAMREPGQFHPKLVPALLVLAAAAGLFGKFAVADRLAQVDRAQAQLSALRSQIAQLQQATADFDQVSREYSRYSVGWMDEEEQALVPRTEMLALLEQDLMGAGRVLRCGAAGNLFSAELSGVTLEDASRIVERLHARDDVENVDIYTASTSQEKGKNATISFLITMKPAVPAEGAEGGEGA